MYTHISMVNAAVPNADAASALLVTAYALLLRSTLPSAHAGADVADGDADTEGDVDGAVDGDGEAVGDGGVRDGVELLVALGVGEADSDSGEGDALRLDDSDALFVALGVGVGDSVALGVGDWPIQSPAVVSDVAPRAEPT